MPKACGLPFRRPRRRRLNRIILGDHLAGPVTSINPQGVAKRGAVDLPAGKKGSVRPKKRSSPGSGVGSLLMSKVGSFFASAKGRWRTYRRQLCLNTPELAAIVGSG
jgi:hypothetical protein